MAKLMRTHGNRGWYRFYPGDTLVRNHLLSQEASAGDEYTAILRKPLNGPCHSPALVLVAPLP